MKRWLTLLLVFIFPVSAEPMNTKFEYTTFIAQPAEKVWEAITQKKFIDQYYMAPIHTLELREGGKISYGLDKELITGKITKLEAPKTLSHTFIFGNVEGEGTSVLYSIEPVGEAMCALTLKHTGFKSDDQMFADVNGGWPVILSSLKTLLEGREVAVEGGLCTIETFNLSDG